MNYVYNIYLNFNKDYFDFYEWKDTDNIIHINKIPIIKVDNNDFNDIICNIVKLSNNDLDKIINKTEIAEEKNNSTCLIITDSKNICALKFNKKGINTKISSFNLDDEYDILKASKKLKESKINYKIIERRKYIIQTRKELDIKNYLLKTIFNLPFDTLKYIYYDCFNKEENNYKVMLEYINNEIINNNTSICNKIYDILKPISTN